MEMRLAGVVKESVVDGPGVRFTVFFQGCPHHCPGCHNPETHDFAGGTMFASQDILKEIAKRPLLRGVTLSGGEPLSQPVAAAFLARSIKEMGKDVVVYTGFTWEKVLEMADEDPKIRELLSDTLILIEGPFVLSERDLGLFFRGSKNQRAIDVPASLAAGEALEYEFYFPAS